MNLRSIIFKTTVLSTGLTVLALIVVSVISTYTSSESMKSIIANNLRDKALLTGKKIDNFFQQRIADARVVSQADVLESNNLDAIKQYFQEVIEANKQLSNVWHVDSANNITGTGKKIGFSELPKSIQALKKMYIKLLKEMYFLPMPLFLTNILVYF